MSSMLKRWRLAAPVRALLWYRLKNAAMAYLRLTGICLFAAFPIMGSLWTAAHFFGMIAAWPL